MPAPRSMLPLAMRGAERDGVGAGAAGDGLGVVDRAGVGDIGQGELVGAGAEVDRMAVVSALPRVMVSLPVPPVIVSTLATVSGVGEVAEGQAVVAGAEVDRCRC